ncbi:ribosome biogenesis GTP-binding protein YihA/YsxC [Buchnera aphidicola]|uniref:Probable GTP-binding protein EngB n=1 Tax=Buchnera aphidicola (Sarucallis kahawaluokalani) TaxID=1241878 RepID=A0A4D6Y9K3_9GAMM|nr:ribosome biogenesis GTP-binding protein YihA/YsxC [Buchnera aphidicola]QCI26069.1 ribosome biogenesis GTP-binding protein YsxC [Buchnera aphidicola (Sarucallis kahawaluokalani)]
MIINFHMTHFLTSSIYAKCMDVKDCGIEIALIGYSNSGKSTLINCLTRNKKLSRFSKYPGRTSLINFFSVNENLRIVDLPGYGYSKVHKNKQKNYSLVFNYIKYRSCLKGIFLLIDIRRLLRDTDIKFLRYCKQCINIVILLTKCDKMNVSCQNRQIKLLKKQLFYFSKNIKIILFSSVKCIGLINVLKIIDFWFYKYVIF